MNEGSEIMHDVFYFTDIHGVRPLFDAIMNFCNEQDPEATIIYGGDAIDRGRDGYAIMKELLDNPQVIYLKGNHEDMFCKAAREIKQLLKFDLDNLTREEVSGKIYWCRNFDYRYCYIQDSLYNGGLETLTDWVMDGMPMDLIERIEHLPFTFSYGKCDFAHAAGLYRTFKEVADAEYEGKEPDEYARDSIIWSRSTLDVGWAPNRVAIFGHTPTPYLDDYVDIGMPENRDVCPVLYRKNVIPEMTGLKIDMDTGAVFTNIAYVLNVLTMRAQGFQISENNKDQAEKISYIQFSY